MPKIQALHQLILGGEKHTDPQRVIDPGKGAQSIVDVSAEEAKRLVDLGAAVRVTAEEAKQIANGDDGNGAGDGNGADADQTNAGADASATTSTTKGGKKSGTAAKDADNADLV